MKDFFNAINDYLEALSLLSKKGLWKFLLMPAIISLLVAIFMGAMAYFFGGALGGWLIGFLPAATGEGFFATIWNWILSSLQSAAGFMGIILSIAFGLIIYKNLVIVLVGPFLSPLSEKVEGHLNNSAISPPPFLTSFIRGLRLAIRNIIRELLFVIPLFFLGLFPLFSIPAAILIFMIQAYYAGAGNMDVYLERHLDRKESIRFVKYNRGLCIGNGTIFMLLLSIGIGFLIAPPLAAIAATISGNKKLNE